MTPIITLLDETEQQLAPLERLYCLAEWDAAVGGDDTAEDRVVEASLALEDVLSDPDRFATARAGVRAGRSARRAPADAAARREPGLPASARPRRAHRAPRGEPADALLQASRADRRAPGLEQRDRRDPAQLERSRRAPRCLGRVEGDRTRGPPCRCASSRRLRNEAARGARLPRPLRDGARAARSSTRAGCSGLLDQLDDVPRATRGPRRRPRSTTAQRAPLGIAADETLRPWDYADAFFQDAPLVEDDALEAALAALDPLAASRAYFGALGDADRGDPRAQRPLPARRRRTSTPSASRSIAATTCASSRTSSRASAGSRRCCTSSATRVYDVAIERDLPWLLRRHAHIFATEAIAMLHGRATRDPIFLRTLLRRARRGSRTHPFTPSVHPARAARPRRPGCR